MIYLLNSTVYKRITVRYKDFIYEWQCRREGQIQGAVSGLCGLILTVKSCIPIEVECIDFLRQLRNGLKFIGNYLAAHAKLHQYIG